LRIEKAATAADGASEGALEEERRRLSLGPAEAAKPPLPEAIAWLAADDAGRKVAQLELAELVAAVTAAALGLLAYLEGSGVEKREHLVVIHVRLRR
jgi:hypothetical protein